MTKRFVNFGRRLLLVLAAGAAAWLSGCAMSPRDLTAPDVQLVGLALQSAGISAQQFRVDLRVTNTNEVDIPIDRLSFALRVGGAGVMRGSSVEPFTLEPGAARTVQLDVETNLVSSLSRLLALLQGPDDAIGYDLEGLVTLARGMRPTFPFSKRGEIPLAVPVSVR